MKRKVNLLGTKDELLYYRLMTTEKNKKWKGLEMGSLNPLKKIFGKKVYS